MVPEVQQLIKLVHIERLREKDLLKEWFGSIRAEKPIVLLADLEPVLFPARFALVVGDSVETNFVVKFSPFFLPCQVWKSIVLLHYHGLPVAEVDDFDAFIIHAHCLTRDDFEAIGCQLPNALSQTLNDLIIAPVRWDASQNQVDRPQRLIRLVSMVQDVCREDARTGVFLDVRREPAQVKQAVVVIIGFSERLRIGSLLE